MKILFLCVANSARSQMAEGIARQLLAEYDVEVMSAGSAPTFVHPLAIAVMDEHGLDISAQYSKSVSDIDLQKIDLIITLCADEVCPYVPGTVEKRHWPLKDPASPCKTEAEQQKNFREIRDELNTRIETLKVELIASGKLTALARSPRL